MPLCTNSLGQFSYAPRIAIPILLANTGANMTIEDSLVCTKKWISGSADMDNPRRILITSSHLLREVYD